MSRCVSDAVVCGSQVSVVEIALNGEVALAIKRGLAWQALICGPALIAQLSKKTCLQSFTFALSFVQSTLARHV